MNETASSLPTHRRHGWRPGRLARVASGAAAVVVLVVGGAAPAHAEPTRTMSIDPADDITTSPTVTGSFTGATALGLPVENISGVDLAVSPTGPTGGAEVTQDGCEVGSGCTTGQVSYTWEVPALDYNGPYVVTASATYCAVLCLGAPQRTSAPTIAFRLAAEPKAPTDLKLEGGDDRSVVVSWARNGEPDVLYYALFRKDPGGDFRRLGPDIKQTSSGRPTFTDTSAAGTSGGDFAYKVFAVRKGLSGDDKTTKISKASSERSTTVAPPPTSSTNPGDPSAPVTTVAGQGVDIGSFLSGQAPTLPSPGPIFLDLPDTGFGETLPFGSLPDDPEPGEEDAVLPTPRQRQVADFKRNRPLIPVAAGAILLVLAGHIRLLNVRTKAVPEKPAPGTYVARALEAARASSGVSIIPAGGIPIDPIPIPIAVAAAVANGAHHRVPDDDLAALPVWAEFEPASALGLLDAPDDADWVRPAAQPDDAEPAELEATPTSGVLDAAADHQLLRSVAPPEVSVGAEAQATSDAGDPQDRPPVRPAAQLDAPVVGKAKTMSAVGAPSNGKNGKHGKNGKVVGPGPRTDLPLVAEATPATVLDATDPPVLAEFDAASALGLFDAPEAPPRTARPVLQPDLPVWAEFDAASALGLFDAPAAPAPVRAVAAESEWAEPEVFVGPRA